MLRHVGVRKERGAARAALALLALACLAPARNALALDPKKAITQYVHDVWKMDQGLPQDNVHAVRQTRDGYLWIGTFDGGLARFDGVRFTVFDPGNTPGLTSTNINDLLEDSEGSLWIGTVGGGISRLRDGKFTSFTTKDGLSGNSISSIRGDRSGNIWAGTMKNGLNRLRDGKVTTFTTKDGLSGDGISSIREDREGNLWIGTFEKGLNRLRDGKFTAFTTKDGLSSNAVYCLQEDREGNLWIGTAGGGLNRLKDGKFTTFTTKDGLSSNDVYCLYEDREGSLWIGTTGGGLNRFRDGMFTSFTTKEGLSDDSVLELYEDREGSLWIGTLAGGLNRLRDGKFTTFGSREGLPSERAMVAYEDREGSLWIGTSGPTDAGLVRLRDGRVTLFTTKDGLSGDHIQSIGEDRDGNLWIVAAGRGLNRFRDGRFTVFTTKDGLSDMRVGSILGDRAGNLWVGTSRKGLDRFRDGRFTSFTTKDGLSGEGVVSMYEDRAGSLWFGTRPKGLSRFAGGKFTSFPALDGLSSRFVLSIHEDREGSLWLGTYGSGLIRFREGRFTSVTTRDGLVDDSIYRALPDEQGNLWMSSNKGVFRASLGELNAVADGRVRKVTCVPYGTVDGIRSLEANGGSPPGWKGRDGRLWFTTLKGVVVVDPAHMPVNVLPPPVVLEEVLVDGKPLDRTSTSRVVLPPRTESLGFRYTASSFLVPKRVKFRYRLEGFDREWVEAGTERTARYTRVPPGDYTFRVVACNDDGLWNETGASLSFGLLPRFWQTWWFHGLEGLAGLGLLVGALVLQRRRLATRADHDRKVEELEHARRVQLALLPKGPLTMGPWTVAGGMQTATEVGGDYYGYTEAGGRLCLVIGDATGHGMASGLVAGMLKAVVASLSRTSARSDGPTAWLEDLNAALRSAISQRGLGVCVGIGLADPDTGEVELGMAGIPHPFHVRASGGVTRVPLSGTPLGYLKRVVTATATLSLAAGDRLVLVTDGLIEQVNGADEEWGYRGAEEALTRICASGAGPEEIAERLLAACAAFGDGQPVSDDRTVVVLARRNVAARGLQ